VRFNFPQTDSLGGFCFRNDELKNIVPRYDAAEKIMHAELHINKECVLYFGDKLEEAPADPNIHIFLKFESEAEIRNVYDSLKKEGKVEIELDQPFWGLY